MHEFRVIDLKPDAEEANPITVKAGTPERAAQLALGLNLVRSGSKCDLRARVYFQHPGQSVSMVRLYTKVEDRMLESVDTSNASFPSR